MGTLRAGWGVSRPARFRSTAKTNRPPRIAGLHLVVAGHSPRLLGIQSLSLFPREYSLTLALWGGILTSTECS
jgi:hypothetical protein